MTFANWRRSAALLVLIAIPCRAADISAERVHAAVAELDQFAEQTLKKTGVPGMAIAVVYQDKVIHLKGYGLRDASGPDRVDAETVFQLASVSKPIASTILASLVGEGRIDWDDRMIDRDPDFRMRDPWVTRELTLRDLLCHRSGLADHAGDLIEDIGYDRTEVLRRLRFAKPGSSFRSKYAYTNFGFTAAAVAGARATGQSWENLAAERLYRPLNMNSTSSRYDAYAGAKNRALLHVRVDGKWVANFARNADAQSPAGGVSSTAADVGKWLRLQLNRGKFDGRQIIDEKALDETHRPQIVSHPPGNPMFDRAGLYGLGWNVSYDESGQVRVGHSGAFDMGAATYVGLLPSARLGIAVLTNAAPIGVPEATGASFFDLAMHGKIQRDYLSLFGRVFEEIAKPTYGTAIDYTKPLAHKTPSLPLDTYEGAYHNDYFGLIQIAGIEGALQLRMGPKQHPYNLRHWDRDMFLYQPVGEMSAGLSAVGFRIGPDQKADTVVIENLDQAGQGSFRRVAKRK